MRPGSDSACKAYEREIARAADAYFAPMHVCCLCGCSSTDDDSTEGCAQIVLMVSGDTERIRQVMADRGIQHELLCFQDDDQQTIASWKIALFGHELAIVASHWKAATLAINASEVAR